MPASPRPRSHVRFAAAARTRAPAGTITLLLCLLALGACGSSGGETVVYRDPWDYDYRYRSGIYDHHRDYVVVTPDRPDQVSLPDRPRPRPARPARGGGRGGGGRGGRR